MATIHRGSSSSRTQASGNPVGIIFGILAVLALGGVFYAYSNNWFQPQTGTTRHLSNAGVKKVAPATPATLEGVALSPEAKSLIGTWHSPNAFLSDTQRKAGPTTFIFHSDGTYSRSAEHATANFVEKGRWNLEGSTLFTEPTNNGRPHVESAVLSLKGNSFVHPSVGSPVFSKK